jgi:hypothetical protein
LFVEFILIEFIKERTVGPHGAEVGRIMDAFGAQELQDEGKGFGPGTKMMNLGVSGLGTTFESAEISCDRRFGHHGQILL